MVRPRELINGICAGIDASGYRSTQAASNEYETGSPPVTDEERFQSCEK
jgi:hypothetical protein